MENGEMGIIFKSKPQYKLNPNTIKTIEDVAWIIGNLGLEINEDAENFDKLIRYFEPK